jgi:hypothetical protein
MMLSKRSLTLLGSVLAVALIVAAVTMARIRWPDPVTLAEGTPVQVRLNAAVDSSRARAGDEFSATVSEPIVENGKTVIPRGAEVKGRVVDARESGHLKGAAQLQLALTSVQVGDKSYELSTATASRTGKNHKKRNWEWIGGGGGGGAVIGAIAAGGKGALIGGPIGAGVGTAVAYFTGKRDVNLPPETHLTFKLTEPVTIAVAS